MKRAAAISFTFLVFVFSLLSEEKISQEHRNWLKTVSPIITKTERETFLKLKTDEERNRFIQIFWKQRDPLPDTSENEFFREYMKRVQFADTHFGRQTSKKGSQTERGFFYLLLGPPLERQQFTTSSKILPLELWYYRGEVQYGLPPYFYLIFYQPQGMGEYRLYHPGAEGPERLVIPSAYGPALDRNFAFQMIREISSELANATLSYLPGERNIGMTPSSSEFIISSAYSLPEKKFSDAYARSYLRYKDYVETDYTHNFIDCHFQVKVFKNARQFFIHWAVEPEKVNFAFYDEKYYAIFQLVLRIEDSQQNPILEQEEEIPLKITPEQYKKHERQLFSFQDVLPIIPGKHKLFFLLKNKTAKDFTSFETEVSVPQAGNLPSLSNLLLYHARENAGETGKRLKAFAFGNIQYLISAQNNFPPKTEMGLYCQVFNLQEKEGIDLLIEIFSLHAEEPVMRLKKPLREILLPDQRAVDIYPLSLSSLKPGYYQLQASLLDQNGKHLFRTKENFILLSRPYTILPWVYSRQHPPFPNPEQVYLLGSQHFMKKNYMRAKQSLEQALKMKNEPRTRLLLAKTLYALGQYQDSLTTVFPVFKSFQDREAAKIIALDYAALEDWASALIYLEHLLKAAVEVSVLNLAAECYLKLQKPKKALPLIQKSLELNPSQPHIRDLEKKIKKFITDSSER